MTQPIQPGDGMTDMEMTKLCAQAMGLRNECDADPQMPQDRVIYYEGKTYHDYDPLHDDAQAMALVKRFRLHVLATTNDKGEPDWFIVRGKIETAAFDLNRAIVECVAKMQAATEGDTKYSEKP